MFWNENYGKKGSFGKRFNYIPQVETELNFSVCEDDKEGCRNYSLNSPKLVSLAGIRILKEGDWVERKIKVCKVTHT